MSSVQIVYKILTMCRQLHKSSRIKQLKAILLVEAAGVEPASEKARHAKTTCVSDSVNSTAT